MKAVIAGGRDMNMTPEGVEAIYRIFAVYNIKTLVNGMCPTGIDNDAIKAAKSCGIPITEFPADWEKYGKSAGPRRNREMINFISDGILILFRGGRGTDNIRKEAVAKNIPIIDMSDWKYNKQKKNPDSSTKILPGQ